MHILKKKVNMHIYRPQLHIDVMSPKQKQKQKTRHFFVTHFTIFRILIAQLSFFLSKIRVSSLTSFFDEESLVVSGSFTLEKKDQEINLYSKQLTMILDVKEAKL